MKGTVYVLKCWHRLNKKMKKECVGLYIDLMNKVSHSAAFSYIAQETTV